MRFHRRLRPLLSLLGTSPPSSLASRWANPLCSRFRSVCIARALAIFFASLFTCPLFISPTRKPRAGLNTRVNPIRCKCFRARPSLVLPVLPPLPRPPSPFLSSDFFAERLSRCLLRRLAHGAYIYGRVCARFEASHSRGLHDNVIVSAEGRNKFAGWNVSLSLTHIITLSSAVSFSLTLSTL